VLALASVEVRANVVVYSIYGVVHEWFNYSSFDTSSGPVVACLARILRVIPITITSKIHCHHIPPALLYKLVDTTWIKGVAAFQWEFQDPKMEVLYHIRPYFGGIFPYIGLT